LRAVCLYSDVNKNGGAPDPDPVGYLVFFSGFESESGYDLDPAGYKHIRSGKIRIWPDPNSLDAVNLIHYHVVVPITVSMHCVLSPNVRKV